jgi:transcription elongation factor Elf1
MDTASHHPSVEEVQQAVRSKGGTLSCPLCGREEYAVEEVSLLSAQMAYGAHRVQRAQLVCENCGNVLNFDLTRLRSPAG